MRRSSIEGNIKSVLVERQEIADGDYCWIVFLGDDDGEPITEYARFSTKASAYSGAEDIADKFGAELIDW